MSVNNSSIHPYPAYRPSGVEWLGHVPRHWEVFPNRALFAEVSEREHQEEQMLSVTIARGVIAQDELLGDSSKKDSSRLDRSAYKLVQPGYIAYNKMRAWQGAIGRSELRGIVSPAYVVQRPRDGVDSRYFHYLLRTTAFATEAERWSYGIVSDMWSLRPEHFKMIYSCLPPFPEQTAIVRYLDHANRRIRRYVNAKRKLIALLEEEKQAIINRAVTCGLNPNVRLKPSGVEWLGDVPAHWEMVGLKFLSKRVQNGSTPPTIEPRYYEDGTIPWYGPSSCTSRGEVGAPVRYLTRNAFSVGAARMIHGPALLIVVIGATAGRMALLQRNGSTNQQITSFELKTNLVHPMFVLQQAGCAEHWLRATASTATIPILDANVVSRLWVVVPPVEEQGGIVEYLNYTTPAIDTAIARARRQIELVQEYRTRLIADVVIGKLDVREAAAQLPDEPDGEEPVGEDDPAEEGDGEFPSEDAAWTRTPIPL